jgi:hypothetical protein
LQLWYFVLSLSLPQAQGEIEIMSTDKKNGEHRLDSSFPKMPKPKLCPATGQPYEKNGQYTDEQKSTFLVHFIVNQNTGKTRPDWFNVTSEEVFDESGKPVLTERGKPAKRAVVDTEHDYDNLPSGVVLLGELIDNSDVWVDKLKKIISEHPALEAPIGVHTTLKLAVENGWIPPATIDRDDCDVSRIEWVKGWGQAQTGCGIPGLQIVPRDKKKRQVVRSRTVPNVSLQF